MNGFYVIIAYPLLSVSQCEKVTIWKSNIKMLVSVWCFADMKHNIEMPTTTKDIDEGSKLEMWTHWN